MSILPPKPDTNRRCFRPCYPGTFCACLGRMIPQREAVQPEEEEKE